MPHRHQRFIGLEHLVYALCIPPALVAEVDPRKCEIKLNDPESIGLDLEAYKSELRAMALRNPWDLEEFRGFVTRYKDLYGEHLEYLMLLKDDQIRKILGRVREEKLTADKIFGKE